MAKTLYFLLALISTYLIFSQQRIDFSLVHDGITRTYFVYVPASYSGNEKVPLIIDLHGYTSNANQ